MTFMRWASGSATLSMRSTSPLLTIFPPNGWMPAAFRPFHQSSPNPGAPKRNMFAPSSIIVGLEIATSKVCAVVGELGADNVLNIVGLGQARSRGVRKGEIADPVLAEEDIRHAIVEA